MATKSYSKHKEYKEYSSSGTVPYTDEQFDMIKSDLIPKGSKLNSLGRNGVGAREYHYEYKEEVLPGGKYDRKDMHTVEDYTIPSKSLPKASESNSYYYEREERELPAIGTGTRTYNYETTSSTPGYSKVKSSKVTKEMTQNVEELDSLLDDLQRDQERQLYKGGYTSDTAESSSFDYRRGTPIKPAPSSGYSTLKREERLESAAWSSSPPPPVRSTERRQELYREEKTESRVVPSQISPALPIAVPPTVCSHCHQPPNTGTLSRSATPMNKVTTTVKTYTYEVPAGQDPTTVPLPTVADHQHTYIASENTSTTSSTLHAVQPGHPVQPVHTVHPVQPLVVSPAPPGGCQHCSHCNSHVREYRTVTTSDVTDRTNERVVQPAPAPTEPHNGHGPYGPNTYKYSETTYSAHNTTQRFPSPSPGPQNVHLHPAPSPSPGPFPRSTTPSPGNQQTPKKLDDLLADFPEARFPTQPDGVTRRRVETRHEGSSVHSSTSPAGPGTPATPAVKPPPVGSSRNVAGPPVYYPPGHTLFAKKDTPVGAVQGYQASSAAMQGGGSYASARGMYEYESGSRSKEKHYETKTAVPLCLPLCCAMPCVIM